MALRWCASWLARPFSSAYVRRSPSYSTATASGVFTTCASNNWGSPASRGYSTARPLHSLVSRCRSSAPINGRSASRCSGLATAASSNTLRCPSSRSAVSGSNRSLLNSTPPERPSSVSSIPSVRSNLDVRPDNSATSSFSPGRLTAAPGAFCKTNITWKSGPRLKSLSDCSSSTSLSKGTSWCAYAPNVTSFTCPSSSRKVCPDESFVLSTSVLTKKPISPSVSALVRLAMAVPTHTSSCPE